MIHKKFFICIFHLNKIYLRLLSQELFQSAWFFFLHYFLPALLIDACTICRHWTWIGIKFITKNTNEAGKVEHKIIKMATLLYFCSLFYFGYWLTLAVVWMSSVVISLPQKKKRIWAIIMVGLCVEKSIKMSFNVNF